MSWVVKYAPQSVDDIAGNEEYLDRIRGMVDTDNLTHVILAGPPGSGKTTMIRCVLRMMFGDRADDHSMELNACDDRGVEVVRNKIKMFSQKVIPDSRRYRIIVLDEADSMSAGAQHTLQRVMEMYNKHTRFMFACNSSERIIDAIQSRSVMMRLQPVPDEAVARRLTLVAEREGVNISPSAVQAVAEHCNGDLRVGINNLQLLASYARPINVAFVEAACDIPCPAKVAQIVEHCTNGCFEDAMTIVQDLYHSGHSHFDIVTIMNHSIYKMPHLSQDVALRLTKRVSMAQYHMHTSVDSPLQFAALIADLCCMS